ncbi:MAG: 16S rRNA (adenine(1518)-N(6)/adenine(1519)-N(6))-dimethyltransferase RsmA [Syntrophorhabdaceae bacterium]|nr:16S rRNA (adenine(1518)-N(6)/adenine(1519)-N(6))-dimethyltransferase RsmA [Syntrophorhabdaceae bacterium]
MLKKYLSQHLIKDRNILKKMVRLSGIEGDDVIVEVGAGQGDLTGCLCEAAGLVYAIEIDETFYRYLEPLTKQYSNLRLSFCDFLKTSLRDLSDEVKGKRIKVFGNIPYKITAPIIFKIIDERGVIDSAFMTVQKEIGERITAKPASRVYGAISVICQLLAHTKILLRLKASVFVPPPKVDSVFFSMVLKEDCGYITDGFIEFVKVCFENKRKYMKNTLIRHYGPEKVYELYKEIGLLHSIRAEEIEPERFIDIYRFFHG